MENNTQKINWFPGHMAKTRRQIKEYLKQVDVVFELLDARIPFSSRIDDVEEIIGNKPQIIILTKWDLCDKEETAKWIKYYEEQGNKVIKFDLTKNIDQEVLIGMVMEVTEELRKKRELKGLKPRRIRAMIIGIPNVGKSTLINRLVGKKATRIGNKPGVTTSIDWIRISDVFELLDTPGILWPKIEDQVVALNLASLSAIKESILPISDIVDYIMSMYQKYYPYVLKDRYDLLEEDYANYKDLIGHKRGCLLKGGNIDYDKVNMFIINDLKSGLINGITFDRYMEE